MNRNTLKLHCCYGTTDKKNQAKLTTHERPVFSRKKNRKEFEKNYRNINILANDFVHRSDAQIYNHSMTESFTVIGIIVNRQYLESYS